jgi:hypothetical protein
MCSLSAAKKSFSSYLLLFFNPNASSRLAAGSSSCDPTPCRHKSNVTTMLALETLANFIARFQFFSHALFFPFPFQYALYVPSILAAWVYSRAVQLAASSLSLEDTLSQAVSN